MKKILAYALLLTTIGMMLAGCAVEINHGERDILYKDIVYIRSEFPNQNLVLLGTNKVYIGDFLETYAYGQQLPWEVFTLNAEENVLYSHHALWVKPGYSFPDEYGEAFSKAEYVISEGILDEYREEITPLITFEETVMLEDVIESEPTPLTEFTSYADVRFHYKNHADMAVFFTLCSKDGEYYLNVREDVHGDDVLFRIKEEYVNVLTLAIKE